MKNGVKNHLQGMAAISGFAAALDRFFSFHPFVVQQSVVRQSPSRIFLNPISISNK